MIFIRLKPTLKWAFLATLISLGACTKQPSLLVVGGPSMGTTWSVKALANKGQSSDVLAAKLQSELDHINALMSNWLKDSEVSLFNRGGAGCHPLSEATALVVSAALNLSVKTDGAFDITIGSLVQRWGFGERFTGDSVPPEAKLTELLKHSGYQQLRMEAQSLCKANAQTQINLSAIAKGYAVDQLALILMQLGFEDYLVEVGGELYAQGQSPKNRPWTIGVEQPVSGQRAIMESIAVPISSQGVATSGDYRNYFEKNGKRYSHILNPVTGRPVEHQLASVTVLAPNSMLADAWATALLVMGVEKGLEQANRQGLAVLMIQYSETEKRGFTLVKSSQWPL